MRLRQTNSGILTHNYAGRGAPVPPVLSKRRAKAAIVCYNTGMCKKQAFTESRGRHIADGRGLAANEGAHLFPLPPSPLFAETGESYWRGFAPRLIGAAPQTRG